MAKNAGKIAARMADHVMRNSGAVNKSYGARQQWIAAFTPIGEFIVWADKVIKSNDAVMKQNAERLTRDEKHLQELQPEPVARGLTDFIPDEFEIRRNADRRINRQVKTINGHGDTSGIPLYHPEHPFNDNNLGDV